MDGSKNLSRRPPIGEAGRRLLRELGIDVWLLRPVAGAVALESQPASAPAAPRVVPEAPIIPQDVASEAPPAPVRGAERQLSVICLSVAGAVLMAPADQVRQFRRCARDLVFAVQAASGGVPDRAIREYEFFWPQPGAGGDLRRAFSAFADKRLGDAGARFLLLPETLLDELVPALVHDRVLVIPDLSRLAVDADGKRELWQSILQRSR